MWRRRGSARWGVGEGIIDFMREERWYTVHVFVVTYHYEAEGQRRTGSGKINFFKGESSHEFRRRSHAGMAVKLRVNPKDVEASVMD
jgi:hypothetical protein